VVGVKKISTGQFFGLDDMLALPNYMIADNAPVNVPVTQVIDPNGQVEAEDKFHDAVGEEEKK
jgi:hypothetical protein